jgi:hypothetical protein
MEQALISCFGEMADGRRDIQISCRAKNARADCVCRHRPSLPRAKQTCGWVLALKSAAAESPSDEGGARLRQFSPKPSREVLVKSRPDRGRSPAGLRTHRLTGAGKSNPFSYLPSLPVPWGWNSVGAIGPPDGVRSCLPLRGSSGFTPDSLLRCHTTLNVEGKPAIDT